LISLRVNALQVSPEYRDDMIKAWIKHDLLNIQSDGDQGFIMKILENKEARVLQNITSLVSYIASTRDGIEYLLPQNKYALVDEVAKVLIPLIS
jgi:hypothetical protein